MVAKIAQNKPNSYFLLNGDEAAARGALEAGIKVAAAYPGTPSTEILETIAEVAKTFGVYAEWSINEIVAVEVAVGASMAGVRSIVSMKHVGLNVAADAAMTLAYTGVVGGMVIAVCDDPAMHSSQNEQDTRFFSVHSNIPLLDAGNPQEAYEMTRDAFELSEKLQLPIIVRMTTRVAHGKARVQVRDFQNIKRVADFDKDGCKWVMVPQNALRQHRVLLERLQMAEKLADQSRFNFLEDNAAAVGVVGSGIGYYHAKSLMKSEQFSWLKLGFVYPFPRDLVRRFCSKLDKVIVVEELRPYIEDSLRGLEVEVLGKHKLGLQEIGEFTPDAMRAAFAKIGYCDPPSPQMHLDLPSRPPVLCPGCPHRAFYYALNTVNQFVSCDTDKCIGCNVCELVCSAEKEKTFNPTKSRIRGLRLDVLSNIALTCRACKDAPCVFSCSKGALRQSKNGGAICVDEEKCDGCGWCIGACQYGAVTLHPNTHKAIICDTCNGKPACVQECPESALTFSGRSNDKVVTGDIGCYTLGVLPPINSVQSCLCMGGGISQAAGLVHAGIKDKVFAVIGDSTFFHAGMPGLLNIAYNKANVCVIILDNRTVAMTGHQPTPESGKTAMGDDAKIVKLESIAKSLGIEKVAVVDPYDVGNTRRVIKEIMDYSGPSVIISERPCPLKIERGPTRKIMDACNGCGVCVKGFGCPAISLGASRAEIDETLCTGCGVCETICPFDAVRRSDSK
ncbi:MAG TPA: thiamine pyrophosphate-dependent enzyme [Candidatus Nanoarchaeia archaeon]|nr:thiamine pyrophosphate-dependent enzyme [Candidatus Nanoarchaeia archaeon]